jgi:isocitrate dehydrogenase
MRDTTKKSKETLTSATKGTIRMITEEDIRKRAFEIYKENRNSSFNEKDNWFYAERELKGYYK